jgi:hypothetical protein
MIPPFFTDDVKAQIATIANTKSTEEVCGLVLLDHTVIEAENIIEKVELEYDGDILNLSTGYAIAQDLISLVCSTRITWTLKKVICLMLT